MRIGLIVATLMLGTPLFAQKVAAPPRSYIVPKASSDPVIQDRWIPFVGGDSHPIVIPIMLNGGSVNALVDTGFPTFTVDRQWPARHNIPVHPYQNIADVGGGITSTSIAPLSSLTIGGTRQIGGAINVADLAPLAIMAGVDFQAVVGADFLFQFAIEIDFDHRRIRFRPSGTTPPPGARVPIRLREEGHRFITSLDIGTQAIAAMIDTGDDGSLALPMRSLSRLAHLARITDLASVGLSGQPYVTGYARIDDVRWGLAIGKAITTFASNWFEEGYDGRIGLALLRRFNVFIDAKQGVMVLAPRAMPPQPDPVTMTGIQGLSTDAGLNIVHIMKGSPAESIGLHGGDRICAVDGNTITANWTGTPKAKWGLGPAGKTVALTMCDGRRLSITLKEFY